MSFAKTSDGAVVGVSCARDFIRVDNCMPGMSHAKQGCSLWIGELSNCIYQQTPTQLTTASGEVVTSKPAVLSEVEDFYGRLYAAHASRFDPRNEDSRAILTRHFTENLPEVSIAEIEIALKQLKNGKAPEEDGVTTELLKAEGKPTLRELQKLFNAVMFEGRTPEALNRSVVVLFFKKGG